nr:phosphoribosyltransferase family protein [Achromobacter sp. UMC46]
MGRRVWSRIGCDCPLCGARVAGARLCSGCETDITALPGGRSRCPRCALRLPALAPACPACLGGSWAYGRTFAAFDYTPPADALIQMLKTRLRLSMAPVLARLLAAEIRRGGGLPEGCLLVPVPASRASLRLRGMNPAGEIARSLAAELALPLARGALRRRRETPRQTSLGRRARQTGATGLFAASSRVRGRHVAVVDDVMTTGSTVQAAASALLAAGAASVTIVVAARTP